MEEKKNLQGQSDNLAEDTNMEGAMSQVIADDAVDDSTMGEEIVEESATGEPSGMAAAKEVMEEKLSENKAPKKKKKTGLIIGIIAAVVVLIVAGITGYFYFFNKTLIGSWAGDTDGIETTLTFKDDGVVDLNMGAITVEGKYEDKGNKTLNIDIGVDGANIISGEYKYEITPGFSDKKLMLTVDNKTVAYSSAQPKELTPPEDFTPVDNLVGTWSNEETGFTYEFTNDGFAIFKRLNMTVKLTYTATDAEITLKGNVGGNDQENTLPYTIADNKLTLAEVEYVKQG